MTLKVIIGSKERIIPNGSFIIEDSNDPRLKDLSDVEMVVTSKESSNIVFKRRYVVVSDISGRVSVISTNAGSGISNTEICLVNNSQALIETTMHQMVVRHVKK